MNRTSNTTKKLVLAALMAALTVAGSALRIKVPSVVGTSAFHLGNILCALSGIFLGPWLGGLSAGLGSAIYDILLDPAYLSESWITFLTKGAYGLVAGGVFLLMKKYAAPHLGKRPEYPCALVATAAGGLTYAVIYLAKSYFYNGLLLNMLTPAAAATATAAKLPATIFNLAVALVGAPFLATALFPALRASHLLQE